MRFGEITPEDNAALAVIIRDNLRAHRLDIPGTVYFDDDVNHLSDFYLADPQKRFYLVLKDDDGTVLGGVGLAEFAPFAGCAELQKLYLVDEVKGRGLGRKLVEAIEEKARELGYSRMYLETHTNLDVAIRLYRKQGFRDIPQPAGVVHSAMDTFLLKEL